MAGTVASLGLGYGFWVIAAREFSASTVGLATGLVSLMTITSVATNVGGSAMVQLLPRRETTEAWSRTLSAGVIAGCAASTFAALAILPLVPLLSHNLVDVQRPEVAALYVVGTALLTLSTGLDFVFIAERQSRLTSVRAAVFGVSRIAIVVVPLATATLYRSVTLIFGSWVLATLISCLVGAWMVRRYVRREARLRLAGAWGELRLIVRSLAGNYLITLGNVLPTYLLPLVVITRLSKADSAYFYIAWMVGNVFFMISSTTGSSLFAEGSHDPEALRAKVIASARFTAALVAPAILVAAVLGREILTVFGPAYASHGYLLLLILAVSAIPDAVSNLYIPLLRVRNRLRSGAALTVGMAMFSVVAGWIVAPDLGLIGIAAAWGVGQTLGGGWVAWDILRSQRRRARGASAADC
ncbi:MAG: lipopolysaccharide biosynthesis protein [Solirubrobacteraceae bacterium]